MKVFIDANIFFDFYRANNDAIKVLELLIENSGSVVLTSQIVDEYYRNREIIISGLRNKFSADSKLDNVSSSLLKSLKEFGELHKIKDEYTKKSKEIVAILDGMIEDAQSDQIATLFERLLAAGDIIILEVNRDIVALANERKLRGNPPASDKYSVGDEISWELLLTIKDDIVIVGRDSTYVRNVHFLKREFYKATGRTLTVTDKITEALKMIGNAPAPDVVKIEEEQVEELKLINGRWRVTSVEGNIVNVTDGRQHGYTLLDTRNVDFSFMCPNCHNYGPWNGSRCLTCGMLSDD